jgi:muramoyltetrapeptide carboxypeptidase
VVDCNGCVLRAATMFDTAQTSRYLDEELDRGAIRKPPRLHSGDVVGVVAPAGAVEAERLAAGVRRLESWGLVVEVGRAVLSRHAYLAGADDERRADLQGMLDDERVRAIFCARGGYGSQRIVPMLDLGALTRAPKPIIGYSDATALLTATVQAGVVAVHGPMVADDMAGDFSPRSESHLRALLAGDEWSVEVPHAIRAGRGRGRLLGGCLSVLVTTLGTPWALDTAGAVLFLEDTWERPYRLDRLLTQMRQAGKLDGLAGLVFGTMAACPPVNGVAPADVIRACCADLDCPVGLGLAAGHNPGGDNLALPLGIDVELDTEQGWLRGLEPAVG